MKKMWSLLRGSQSSGERPGSGTQYDVDGGRGGHADPAKCHLGIQHGLLGLGGCGAGS